MSVDNRIEMHRSEMRQAAASTNLMASTIGSWAKGHGFEEDWYMADKLEALARDVSDGSVDELPKRTSSIETLNQAADVIRRNVIGTKIALCHSELSEALESLRDTGVTKILTEGNFGEELADTEIRVKELAHLLGIDLGEIEIAKIAANAARPYKHGRAM